MSEATLTQLDAESCPQKSGKEYRRRFLGTPRSSILDADFNLCSMSDVGAKGVSFQGCDFSHSLIENSYFRGAAFVKCKFVGSRFLACNFHEATFVECEFSYAKFLNTEIGYDQIIANMPSYPNVRKSLLRVLRANAVTIGKNGDASRFYIEEMETECEVLEKAARPTDGWNVAKSTESTKRRAKWRLRILRLEKLWWGYGEMPLRLVRSTMVAVGLMTLGLCGVKLASGESPDPLDDAVLILTSTIGVSLPSEATLSTTEKTFVVGAGFVGFVTLSLFVAVLLRRIARR